MNGKLIVKEIDSEFELNNLRMSKYRVVGERPVYGGAMMEKFPVGEPITIITSEMPDDLYRMIDETIKAYCNI